MGIIKEYAAFLKEIPRTFVTTGALGPSSKGLAKELTRGLRERSDSARILEVGPGTGAVTSELVREIRPGDHVELVELNERFVEMLNQRFDSEKHFKAMRDQVKIWCKSVEEIDPNHPFDYLVCGLPFNNFPTDLVKRIFRHMVKLVRPGGHLSFFEYLWVRPVRRLAATTKKERQRIGGVGVVLERNLARYEFRREIVWTNVPPAIVHHLRIEPLEKNTSRLRVTARKKSKAKSKTSTHHRSKK